MAAQDQRRDWIIANWPHLVELEQVTALIAQQEPLAHWPANQSPNVRRMLEQLQALAVQPDEREERTLAEIDRLEIDSDPVRRLESRRDHLLQQTQLTVTDDERLAVTTELDHVGDQLRTARRQARSDAAFARYGASTWDQARAARRATVRHDVLSDLPSGSSTSAPPRRARSAGATDPVRLADEIVRGALDKEHRGSPIPVGPAVAADLPVAAAVPGVTS